MKLPSLDQIDAAIAYHSLADFFRSGWHVLEPTTPLLWNWHFDAVCLHLQTALEEWIERQDDEAALQRIQNLLINVPPGTGKSRVVSVFTPAWMWLRFPSWRAIFLSANPRVALRDSMYCRDVINSRWYQEWFKPEWTLRDDQDAKSLFYTTAGGFRYAAGFGSRITGDRADALFCDDPHDAEEVKSKTQREAVTERWDSTIGNRVNDLRSSLRFIVMQRLHEEDLSGHVVKQGGWCHLRLPMRYDTAPACECADCLRGETAIGWSDPRTESEELLFPDRFPEEVVEAEETRLGDDAPGQLQQRPTRAGGDFFKPNQIAILDAAPACEKVVRAWDLGATKTGNWTVGFKLGRKGNRYTILNVKRFRETVDVRDRLIRETAEEDGVECKVRLPQDPGAGGKSAADILVASLAGFHVEAKPVSGDKEVRAAPFASQVNAGNVDMVRGDWNGAVKSEFEGFPKAATDDVVDAGSDAFRELAEPAKPSTFGYNPAGMIRGVNRSGR